MNEKLNKIGKNSKIAQQNELSSIIKNKVLNDYLKLVKKNKNKIILHNKKDIVYAKKKGVKDNLINRLFLDEKKIDSILKSIKMIIKLPDPVNMTLDKWKRPNGLNIKKVTIPIGVIGVIYESRPNVTSDVSALCFKSGNSVILRGGSEAINSNKILTNLFRLALAKNNVNKDYVQFIDSKNREVVDYMLSKMSEFIDIIIPRGGKIENGNCTIEYPKKIFCEYAKSNNKILVSNGKSLVIKTRVSYYRYPLDKTPLNLILDKDFLINKIYGLNERIVDDSFINFTILEKDNEINIFFDKKTYDLVGWQNIDIYQNFNITFLSSIRKNRVLSKNLFKIPSQN